MSASTSRMSEAVEAALAAKMTQQAGGLKRNTPDNHGNGVGRGPRLDLARAEKWRYGLGPAIPLIALAE